MTKSQRLVQPVLVGMRLLPGKRVSEHNFSPNPGITSLYFAALSRLVPGSSGWVQKRKVAGVGNFPVLKYGQSCLGDDKVGDKKGVSMLSVCVLCFILQEKGFGFD